MKSRGLFHEFAAALAIWVIAAGTIGLGLGLSALDYIRYEHAHDRQVPVASEHECTTFLVVGAISCVAGILLWRFGKGPAV